MCRSRRELSNAYFLAKFGIDTAENEPCKRLEERRRLPLLADHAQLAVKPAVLRLQGDLLCEKMSKSIFKEFFEVDVVPAFSIEQPF